MEHSPLVSVITVNYRNPEVTAELLTSIRYNSYSNLEVIVVDNAPLNDNDTFFQEHFPGVITIVSQENVGFAGGNNLGLAASNGEFIFLVNNDTEWTDGLVENLLRCFHDPVVGMAAPKIRYYDQPDTIQYAGFTEVSQLTARNRIIGENEKDEGQYDTSRTVPYAHGAAMMVSREVLEKTGGLPEDYFLYYEELDWCVQIRKAGYRICFQPSALIFHKESLSVGRLSSLKTYYLTRNRILFMRRNAGKWQLLVFFLFFTLVTIPRWTITYLFHREWKHLRAFYNGVGWHLKRGSTPGL